MEKKKILFVKHGALGDIVISIGTIRHIAEQFPGAQFSVMTKAPFRKLMEHIGIFSEYIIDNRASWSNIPAMYRVLNALRTGGFDIIVDLMGNARMHRYREILSSTPISPSRISRLVPPEEKNGRPMPVLGKSAVLTPICQNTCHAICEMMPMPSSVPK